MLLVAVATQLDKNLQGRLMWNAGLHSSINTMAIWDTEKHHLTWAFQVSMLISLDSPSKTCQQPTSIYSAERFAEVFAVLLDSYHNFLYAFIFIKKSGCIL